MKSLNDEGKERHKDRAYCLPTGSIFVSEGVLKGVLPSVLDELLATRAMLKKASKAYRQNISNPPAAVLRQLEARQLALKYVANVTCECLLNLLMIATNLFTLTNITIMFQMVTPPPRSQDVLLCHSWQMRL